MNRLTGWMCVLMMSFFVLASSCSNDGGGGCSDATPTDTCSTTKPMFCAGIDLVKKCSQCGCPGNMTCQTNGDCITASKDCSDGTKDGQCSSIKPSYCSSGTLINKCSQCGCPSGNSADCQGNGTCQGQQLCTDNTPYGQCSSTKPSFCSSGTLIDKCSQCGCPSGNAADCQGSGSCQAQQTCSDGTAYGQCSTTKPSYCSSGTLVDKCSQCGCPSGNSADCQGSGSCQGQQNCSDGTVSGQCSTTKPKYCSAGTLIDKCSQCNCPSGNAADCQGSGACKAPCNCQGSDGSSKTLRVLVINYDPIIESEGNKRLHEVFSWNDPRQLVDGYHADLLTYSCGFANYQVIEWIDADEYPVKSDGFTYDDNTYVTAWRNGGPFHNPDIINYKALITRWNIASRVKSGDVDEVLIFGAPYFGYWESQMVGPDAYWCNSDPINDVDSGREFVIMGFNYERGIGEMLEDYGHRSESIMEHVYQSWNPPPPQHNWDRFTLYDKISSGNAACGNVHFAPNSQSDYDWGNTTQVQSSCDDWFNYPNLTGQKQTVSASSWGNGDIRLHHRWWFCHIPHMTGVAPDSKQANWWKYLADFNSYPESQ